MRVIDEAGKNLGVLAFQEAMSLAGEKGLDLIEISAQVNPPICRIMSFDKFRYHREKEEKKQSKAQKTKELKQVRISPRAAQNDLEIKIKLLEKFLEEGHKVEINLFMRGREKGNRAWSLEKINAFLKMIKIPHQITLPPKAGGRGFVAQVSKK